MIRALITLPLLALLVLFALSNPQSVRLALWPTDYAVYAPLSLSVLIAAGLFFLLGALITWLGAASLRLRARRAESLVRTLEAQLAALRARPAAPQLAVVAGPLLPPPE